MQDIAERLSEYASLKRRLSLRLELLDELKGLAERHEGVEKDGDELSRELLLGDISTDVSSIYEQIGQLEKLLSRAEDPILREILERRYIAQENFSKIALEMHYSERHIRRLHSAALKKLSAGEN